MEASERNVIPASAFAAPLMSDDTLKIRRKISTLASSLDDLETSLTALSSQSLPDLVMGLDTIQQAKLQVVIPYLAYDLVFSPSYFSLHAVLPTGMSYSLFKDKGSGPENASSNCGARTFISVTMSGLPLRSSHRTEYVNISIKLRMPKILLNVRVYARVLYPIIYPLNDLLAAQASSQPTKPPQRASSRMPSPKQRTRYRPKPSLAPPPDTYALATRTARPLLMSFAFP